MIARTAFLLGILTGLAIVIWGPPPLPFSPDSVSCYRRTQPEGIKPEIPMKHLYPNDEKSIAEAKEAIAENLARAMIAVRDCIPGSCTPVEAAKFIERVWPYFILRQRLTTRLFEARGKAARNITPLIFNSEKDAALKHTLKALVLSNTIDLAAFRHQRWIAAMFVFKNDEDIRPCAYQGP